MQSNAWRTGKGKFQSSFTAISLLLCLPQDIAHLLTLPLCPQVCSKLCHKKASDSSLLQVLRPNAMLQVLLTLRWLSNGSSDRSNGERVLASSQYAHMLLHAFFAANAQRSALWEAKLINAVLQEVVCFTLLSNVANQSHDASWQYVQQSCCFCHWMQHFTGQLCHYKN